MSSDGSAIQTQTILFNNVFGRLRDICVSPSGDIYLSTSNYDGRYSFSGQNPPATDDRIIKLKYNKTVTATADDEFANFTFYPNPSTDKLVVNCKDGTVINVTNIHGVDVASFTVKNSSVDISELSSGAYIIKDSRNRFLGKVMKF